MNHIAIIMDGNGRWATNNKKPRAYGHKMGANKVREITEFCISMKVSYLTLYAFSTENWERPKVEIDFLMKLLENYLIHEEKNYIKNEVKFDFIGDISIFNKKLQAKLFRLKDMTKNFDNLTQILALNYGSKDEISRSILKIKNDLKDNLNKYDILKLIEDNLDTKDFPPVDILIRTGGEKRLSNFLLWQLSYTELFFTDTFWPDFSVQEFEGILEKFKSRIRKFGALVQ